jgi:nitrogen fixation/metabolism regulation signal transduction histidine kinase
MDHQNLQEAIQQLSANESMNSEEIKSNFNLNEEDMIAMQSNNQLNQKVTPRPGYCCCCI